MSVITKDVERQRVIMPTTKIFSRAYMSATAGMVKNTKKGAMGPSETKTPKALFEMCLADAFEQARVNDPNFDESVVYDRLKRQYKQMLKVELKRRILRDDDYSPEQFPELAQLASED